MVTVTSEETINTEVDLSVSGGFPVNRIAAITAHQVESDVLVNQSQIPYLKLMPQFSRQVAVLESTSFPEITLSQKPVGANVIRLPGLEWPAKNHPVLTRQVRMLLETLWAIVVSRATQTRFPIRDTVVSIFTDPDEKSSKAVLRITCLTNASQALAFWDSIETDLQEWLEVLPESDRTRFLTKISMRVYWQ
ncbi:MAG: hypothetical protein HY529_06515 [Chloroflexi bacterium]|nr:hypothetical protein [Chloroflexota bacterium]